MLLNLENLCDFLGCDEPTALALIEGGHLPAPVNVGDRLVRWREADLHLWVRMGCPDFISPSPPEFTKIRERQIEERLSAVELAALESDRADNDQINAGAAWTSSLPIPEGFRPATNIPKAVPAGLSDDGASGGVEAQ